MTAPLFTAAGRIRRRTDLALQLALVELDLDDPAEAAALLARLARRQAAAIARAARAHRGARIVWRSVPPFALAAPRLSLIGPAPDIARPGTGRWRALFDAAPIPLHAAGVMRLEPRLRALTRLAAPSFSEEIAR